jgi:hypothetical protein
MFRIIIEKIAASTRRVSVNETLDRRDLVTHIQGAIYLFRVQGRKYFTKTMVLDYLNAQIGWPKKNSPESMSTFSKMFSQAVSAYLPCPQVRGGFSFTLKPSPNNQFTDKVLKG